MIENATSLRDPLLEEGRRGADTAEVAAAEHDPRHGDPAPTDSRVSTPTILWGDPTLGGTGVIDRYGWISPTRCKRLIVSEVALGTWLTFGGGISDGAAREILDTAFELGITFIDTANVYNRGAAETVLGELLAARPRDTYVLATKLYFPMTDDDRGLSRAQVLKQIDASLARLRTDFVDLYQCHRYDPETPLEETMEALTEVVRQGKARYIGFSEWTPAADPGGDRPRRRRAVRVEPARVLAAAPRPRARGVRGLRGERDLPDRLVAARAGGAHGQVRDGGRRRRTIPAPARSAWGGRWRLSLRRRTSPRSSADGRSQPGSA